MTEESSLTGLLDTPAAAALIGVAVSTLETWRCTRSDGVAFHKIGRAVRYDRRDIEAGLSARRVTSTSDPVRV